jgi:hypothetical protein
MKKKNERNLHAPVIPFRYDEKLLSKSTDVRIYKGAILLTPGEYTDALSRTPTVYTETELKNSATRWEANFLNLDHSDEVLKRVGYVKNTYYKNQSIRGDLYIFPVTQEAKSAIGLIDSGLVNWLSVELTSEDYWDNKLNKRCASDISYIGCALVTFPACPDTRVIE